jgi:outer membrane protein TolC
LPLSLPLSLDECRSLAAKNAPEVRQAEAALGKARSSSRESKGELGPKLSAEGALDFSDDLSKQLPDDNKAVLKLEQELNASAWAENSQKRREEEVSLYGLSEARSAAALRASELYYAALRDKDSLSLTAETEDRYRDLAKMLRPHFYVGPNPDKVKIAAGLAGLAHDKDGLVASLEAGQADLALLCGLSMTPEPMPSEDEPEMGEEKKGLAAVGAQPHLEALRAEVRAAEAGLNLARVARWPSLEAGAEAGASGQSADGLESGWDLRFGAKLPLWDAATSARIQGAEWDLAARRDEFASESASLASDWERARKRALLDLEDLKRWRELLPDLDEAAKASVFRYRKGAIGILEAADAIQTSLQAHLQERASHYSYLMGMARLNYLERGP